jgi:hypothetical protein
MFKIVLIFLTIIFYKILTNTLIQKSILSRLNQIAPLPIIGYNIIYFYSVCQIKCYQLYNKFLPYLDIFKNSNNVIDDIKIQTLQIVELFDLNTNKNKLLTEREGEVFNQILFSIRSPNNLVIISELSNKISNKKIINKKIDTNICNYNFDISKITFIALYLNYNDVRYNINLKTDAFNYYLVGNIIDKQFVQYYINNILKLPFNYEKEDMLSYHLELMDHEVNMISLNDCQYILIEKDSYRICQ